MKKILLAALCGLMFTACTPTENEDTSGLVDAPFRDEEPDDLKAMRAEVEAAIDAANYCETDTDCTIAYGECPFSCHLLLNVNEVDNIQTRITAYNTERANRNLPVCMYSCIQPPAVVCRENKCVFAE